MNSIYRRAALLLFLAAPLGIATARAESALCEDGQCAPAISAVTYQSRDAFKLTDGKTEAIIVPQIGRIMRFGKVGGPNLLWNLPNSPTKDASWKNYGGDKNWLAPQSSWPDFNGKNWPPDLAFDGQEQSAEVLTGGKVQMTTPLSASGIRITRTMYFDANGEFVIEQTARKEKGATVRASIWNITQVVPGEAIFFSLAEKSDYESGFANLGKTGAAPKFERVKPNLGRVIPNPTDSGTKIGVDSPVSALVSVRDGMAFVQKSPKPLGNYPDGIDGKSGFPTELYLYGDAKNFYAEMEMLGPLKNFSVGGKSTHTLRWSLHNLPSKDVQSPALINAVEKLIYPTSASKSS